MGDGGWGILTSTTITHEWDLPEKSEFCSSMWGKALQETWDCSFYISQATGTGAAAEFRMLPQVQPLILQWDPIGFQGAEQLLPIPKVSPGLYHLFHSPSLEQDIRVGRQSRGSPWKG